MAHPNQRDRAALPVELRRTGVPPAVRAWVGRATGDPVVAVRRLPGASTTAVHAVVLAGRRRLVLRRYAWPFVLEEEPVLPRRELDALEVARRNGLAVPAVVAADPTGNEVGDGVPVLLMTFLPGRAVGAPDPHRLAEVAAGIHAVDPDGLGHDWFPWREGTTDRPPPGTRRPALWERAIARWQDIPDFRPTFVHRDFHPGNVLWSRRRATGTVDWANGCRGPWECDVGICRRNLVAWAPPGDADRFLTAYEDLTGRHYDPFWDVASILEGGSPHRDPSDLAVDEERLARALAQAG